ncbi:SAM-dependent MidA family methyltransferase [Martelella mediterranea]|uniref:SAM-dependent MidA family methyltransferase n=2 Tax=Martelella mediterranea TaxID=293089 RepID=A0A4R3NUI4_9HYPH|nr:SAM-dependent MidA family methyltransferase [Martelella mediterranea]
MPVSTYFNLCLADNEHGYYKTRDPFGKAGDFTTAPEISQLFGELIGVFLVHAWQRNGEPDHTVLIEGGPGRGTMMADILNVIATLQPRLYDGLRVNLLETSPALRSKQAETLQAHRPKLKWIDNLGEAAEGFTMIVANELFDAIATRQFIKTANGFFERVVGLDDNGNLSFGIGPAQLEKTALPKEADRQPEGTIFETSPAREALMADICERLATQGGTALLIDYGHLRSGFGDTLQALRGHAFDPPLAHPGEADLTSHVDFEALVKVAIAQKLHVHPPLHQGDFLSGLGLGPRASALGRGRDAETQRKIVESATRLAGDGPDDMGDLFKVLAISHTSIALTPFDKAD